MLHLHRAGSPRPGAEAVNKRRRDQLRRRYLTLRNNYYSILDGYSCGIALAETIDKELSQIGREMGEIEAEVTRAVAEAEL